MDSGLSITESHCPPSSQDLRGLRYGLGENNPGEDFFEVAQPPDEQTRKGPYLGKRLPGTTIEYPGHSLSTFGVLKVKYLSNCHSGLVGCFFDGLVLIDN